MRKKNTSPSWDPTRLQRRGVIWAAEFLSWIYKVCVRSQDLQGKMPDINWDQLDMWSVGQGQKDSHQENGQVCKSS